MRTDLYAVKYPGLDWTIDFSGELRRADVVGMRVAKLVEIPGPTEAVSVSIRPCMGFRTTVREVCIENSNGLAFTFEALLARDMAKFEEGRRSCAPCASQDGVPATLTAEGVPQPPPEVDPAEIGAECVYRPETGPQCSCPEWPCADSTLCERVTKCGVTR